MKPGQELVGHSGNDGITTPIGLFNYLDRRFKFTYDAAAGHDNNLCDLYSTESDGTWRESASYRKPDGDGLNFPWVGQRVFCNPPYSQPLMGQFIQKAIDERNNAEVIVLLVKCDTSTRNFSLLQQYFHLEYQPRIKYGGMAQGATFASVIAIVKPDVWKPKRDE